MHRHLSIINFNKGEFFGMEKLLKVLCENYPTIDFKNEKALVTGGILDSVEVVSIIAEIEDTFDISISMEYIKPENFDSVEAMWKMIEELE